MDDVGPPPIRQKKKQLVVQAPIEQTSFKDVHGHIHETYQACLLVNRKAALRHLVDAVASYGSLEVDQVVEHFEEWVKFWTEEV